MLYLYNSLTRKKEKFVPLYDKKVKIYVCGITPYDTTHLGHAFTYVFFDVLTRFLRFKGFDVAYTQNITDIDDDILKKAKEEKKDWKELGEFWTNKFLKDMKALNVGKPTNFVKATDSIDLMIHMIKKLIKKGFAYENNGNVYFEVKKFKNYGQLSGYSVTQMILISQQRGGNPKDPLKKDPLDFLLWQKSKSNEPFWESPFGKGRPGWHIECSAMIKRYLGDQIDPFDKLRVNGEYNRTIDIHGGGRDLIFPHHESEIAQSESYSSKKPFVKFWMHTSMVLHLGEKMAKSLDNLVMINTLLKNYSANEIKWFLLSHHYRKPWEFDENELLESKKVIALINRVINTKSNNLVTNKSKNVFSTFNSFMEDDINTPKTLNYLTSLAKNNENINVLRDCLLILGFDI